MRWSDWSMKITEDVQPIQLPRRFFVACVNKDSERISNFSTIKRRIFNSASDYTLETSNRSLHTASEFLNFPIQGEMSVV